MGLLAMQKYQKDYAIALAKNMEVGLVPTAVIRVRSIHRQFLRHRHSMCDRD